MQTFNIILMFNSNISFEIKLKRVIVHVVSCNTTSTSTVVFKAKQTYDYLDQGKAWTGLIYWRYKHRVHVVSTISKFLESPHLEPNSIVQSSVFMMVEGNFISFAACNPVCSIINLSSDANDHTVMSSGARLIYQCFTI